MPTRLVAVSVTFRVMAEGVEEAQQKVKQIIEHGNAVHDGEVEWSWADDGQG